MSPSSDHEKALAELRELVKETSPELREIKVDITVSTADSATTCIERLRESYAVINAAFVECYQALQVVRQTYRQNSTPGELIDILHCMREIMKFADDLRKQYVNEIDQCEFEICERWSRDPLGISPIHGRFAKGSPNYRDRYKLPTFADDPEGYNAVMEWLGVADDLRDKGKELLHEGEYRTKIVDISYNGFNDMCEKYTLAGYAIPECIEKYRIPQKEPIVKIYKKEDLL